MSIQIEKDIISLSNFRASYKEYIDSLKEGNRSIVLTQNGKAAAVVLSPQEYDQLKQQQKVMTLPKGEMERNPNIQIVCTLSFP